MTWTGGPHPLFKVRAHPISIYCTRLVYSVTETRIQCSGNTVWQLSICDNSSFFGNMFMLFFGYYEFPHLMTGIYAFYTTFSFILKRYFCNIPDELTVKIYPFFNLKSIFFNLKVRKLLLPVQYYFNLISNTFSLKVVLRLSKINYFTTLFFHKLSSQIANNRDIA